MRNNKLLVCCIPVLALAVLYFAGITGRAVKADKKTPGAELTTTPQTLPFSQNWTNAGLITANDDWSGVPGITGYRGDDLTMAIATDPRTILADGSATPVDVNANQTNPDTFITGGVSEFDTIANPTVALQGSGTADAPHLVIYLNTTGAQNINFQCNIRDIDGSADDAVQQVDVQFRVGGAGNYTSLTGGYIADATTGGTATQVTPLNLNLPAGANNQALVEIRVMTTNATGNDEWVGVDDISVTGGPPTPKARADFDGDGKSDVSVFRPSDGNWYILRSSDSGFTAIHWGLGTDQIIPGDYDGDGKTDTAVYRPSNTDPDVFVLNSNGFVFTAVAWGSPGDVPVMADYDGDGKTDYTVFRPSTGDWYVLASTAGYSSVHWGATGDIPIAGDFDGDGKTDFTVYRAVGNWYTLLSGGGVLFVNGHGGPIGKIVVADFDGDGKDDYAYRESGVWHIRRANGTKVWVPWGPPSARAVPADYDGDGKDDLAVYADGAWYIELSSTDEFVIINFGVASDKPIAEGYIP